MGVCVNYVGAANEKKKRYGTNKFNRSCAVARAFTSSTPYPRQARQRQRWWVVSQIRSSWPIARAAYVTVVGRGKSNSERTVSQRRRGCSELRSFFSSFLLSLSFSFESKLAGKGAAEQNGSTSEKYIYTHTYIYKRAKSRTVLFFLLSLSHFTVRHAPRESR